jgi:hypothetical protein
MFCAGALSQRLAVTLLIAPSLTLVLRPPTITPSSVTSLNQRQSADKAAAVNGHCVTPVMCILSLNYCVGGVGASLTHD